MMSPFIKLPNLKPADSIATAINFLVLVMAVLLIYAHPSLPPKIPFWYSKQWGLDRLTNPNSLWLIPILILVSMLTNYLFSSIVYKNHLVVAKILAWTSVFTSLVFLYSLYRILTLVT